MGSDFSIRPIGAPLAGATAATDPARNVATQLPLPQAVAPVAASARPEIETKTLPDAVAHQVMIDRAAATIVYQTIDERTAQVVRQFPDDAMLRRRAYFRTLDLLKQDAQPMPTDRTA